MRKKKATPVAVYHYVKVMQAPKHLEGCVGQVFKAKTVGDKHEISISNVNEILPSESVKVLVGAELMDFLSRR